MAFRADEAARIGYEQVEAYLVPRARDAEESERVRCKEALLDIIDELGPVIDTYPAWHPLVCNHDSQHSVTTPSDRCGYKGLDHTRYFANGFITCPYDDGQKVIDSVKDLPMHPVASITAERLDLPFYNSSTTPILVKCEWDRPLSNNGMIPLSLAMPLILEREVPCWRWAQLAESWETMRPDFLGTPNGARSSLFVDQETGQAIKKVWNAIIHTGMYGPIKV
tara:strand:- start:4295 stop:4963 length:669 start_codon:yes stop_codon:yes gene_type:complete